MNVLLEAATSLGRPDGGKFLHRGLEQFRDIPFDLFAYAWVFQRAQHCGHFTTLSFTTATLFFRGILREWVPLSTFSPQFY
jgi:hypothetical protein